MQEKKRPLGVTIIAILAIIGGIGSLVGGAALALGSALLVALDSDFGAGVDPELAGNVLAALGVILVAFGIAYFVLAAGLLKGKGWAWMATAILSMLSIAVNIAFAAFGASLGGDVASNLGGSVINFVINGAIIYYLFRPHVKDFFGRAK